MKTMYKVLTLNKDNNKYYSPFQNHCYGLLSDFIGKEFICADFNDNINEDCSNGFYATNSDGIIYSLNTFAYNNSKSNKQNIVFEVEVSGKRVEYSIYKNRYEKQKFIKRLSNEELHQLIKIQSDKMEFNYYEACFPINPRDINTDDLDMKKVLKLLKEWTSMRNSARYSVRDSVGYSTWDSVRYSVRESVGYSTWDSVRYSGRDFVGAYISSLFPNITKWEYIEHKELTNPFQAGIDLWKMGVVASFNGNGMWRLYKGKDMRVFYEISEEDLRGMEFCMEGR